MRQTGRFFFCGHTSGKVFSHFWWYKSFILFIYFKTQTLSSSVLTRSPSETCALLRWSRSSMRFPGASRTSTSTEISWRRVVSPVEDWTVWPAIGFWWCTICVWCEQWRHFRCTWTPCFCVSFPPTRHVWPSSLRQVWIMGSFFLIYFFKSGFFADI